MIYLLLYCNLILNYYFRMEHYRDESLNHNSHNTVSMNFMRERPDHGPPPPMKKPKLLHPISPQPPLKIDISVCINISYIIIMYLLILYILIPSKIYFFILMQVHNFITILIIL